MKRYVFRRVAAVLVALAVAVGVASATPATARPKPEPVPPARVTSIPKEFLSGAVVVFDQQTGRFTESVNPDKRFRSASVIKLLLAIEYLRRGDTDKSPKTLKRLRDMLALSDDQAADHFWKAVGRKQAIDNLKVPSQMNLRHTEVDPLVNPKDPKHSWPWWGYTVTSARDIVQMYRYLQSRMFVGWRVWIRAAMASAPRCAKDRFDQHFGIPRAFRGPPPTMPNRPPGQWPIKQGWSLFPQSMGTCRSAAATAIRPLPKDVDFSHRALHTTGLVGPNNRNIVVVLTVHKPGTSFTRASDLVTKLTRSLNVPGAVRR
jgi:hypothetical protein